MKVRNVVGATGLAAVLVALSATPGYSQTAINVPENVDSYAENADPDDPCLASYEAFLNEPACEAAREAALLEEETIPTAEEDLTAAQEEFDAAIAEDSIELAALNDELTTAQTALDEAEADLATAVTDAATAQQAAEDIALAVNTAERPLLAEAAREGLTLDEFIDENADDERVVALLALRTDYDAALADALEKQEAITGATELRDDALTVRDEAAQAVSDYVPVATAELFAAVATAQAALDEAEAALAAAQALADTPLPAGENVNYDILTGSDANPAKAVLEASICAAAPDSEGCVAAAELASPADVGQAIVEGLDSLHQTDLALAQSLDDEQTARIAADVALGERIDDEEAARIAADDVLQANIDAEAATRAAADVTLQENIDAEAATRAAADTTLQANIDAEAATRAAADDVLTASVAAESAARAAADVTLQNNINALDARVTQLGQRVDALTKESRQGIAMAMALAAIPTVNYGKFSLGLGVGTFASETAAAVGMDFVISERVKFKVGFSTTGDESGGSAGFAIGF
jgi:hypothetical protein